MIWRDKGIMQRFKTCVSYDGAKYSGWQVQPRDVSVQGTIEAALKELSGEIVKVHGSGRTDQGVHARHQFAHFDLEKKFSGKALRRALNALLPDDIRILNAVKVPDSFHARYSAVSKEYRYFIFNAEVMPPMVRAYRTHVRSALDIGAMQLVAKQLVGEHDFSAFSASGNKSIDNYVRNLFELKVSKRGSEIVITAKSNGFLYKMVRSIAGCLIKAGKGQITPKQVAEVLKSRKRTQHVETAKPQGLFLWNVSYK